MHTREITAQNLVEMVKTPGVVLIDWLACWCGPCRAFAPPLEDLIAKVKDLDMAAIVGGTEAHEEASPRTAARGG